MRMSRSRADNDLTSCCSYFSGCQGRQLCRNACAGPDTGCMQASGGWGSNSAAQHSRAVTPPEAPSGDWDAPPVHKPRTNGGWASTPPEALQPDTACMQASGGWGSHSAAQHSRAVTPPEASSGGWDAPSVHKAQTNGGWASSPLEASSGGWDAPSVQKPETNGGWGSTAHSTAQHSKKSTPSEATPVEATPVDISGGWDEPSVQKPQTNGAWGSAAHSTEQSARPASGGWDAAPVQKAPQRATAPSRPPVPQAGPKAAAKAPSVEPGGWDALVEQVCFQAFAPCQHLCKVPLYSSGRLCPRQRPRLRPSRPPALNLAAGMPWLSRYALVATALHAQQAFARCQPLCKVPLYSSGRLCPRQRPRLRPSQLPALSLAAGMPWSSRCAQGMI